MHTTVYSVLDLGLTEDQLLAHMEARRSAAAKRPRRPMTPEEEAELDAVEASWGR